MQAIPQKGKELMEMIFRHDTVSQIFLIPKFAGVRHYQNNFHIYS